AVQIPISMLINFGAAKLLAELFERLESCRTKYFRPCRNLRVAVAQIGPGMGIIQKPEYAVAVFRAVATTIVAPLLEAAFRGAPSRAPEEQFVFG
ncbi:MAG TPA: hypothetical protein VEQ63_12570, partial [Bryobacteraceae bacterium]|nr:hypothetical protein [Bryobacteraceae bacterium]